MVKGDHTNLETLESRASSWAASPSIFSPRFSFSISKPPSYLPISNSRLEVGLDREGFDAGAGAFLDADAGGLVVADWEEPAGAADLGGPVLTVDFGFCSGKGWGAANLVRSFETLA